MPVIERHPNPVIAAVDDGHIERTTLGTRPGASKKEQEVAEAQLNRCKADGQVWPCAAMMQAQVDARIRSEHLVELERMAKRAARPATYQR